MKSLNRLLDADLERELPEFTLHSIELSGPTFKGTASLLKRDTAACAKWLFESPLFADYLLVEPMKLYADEDGTDSIIHEMNTGDWWWDTQEVLEKTPNLKGATIVPIILALDKTTLTSYNQMEAYPVYMTIGNIPKALRKKISLHTHILVGYLPTDRLSSIEDTKIRKLTKWDLKHACLHEIFSPLMGIGQFGVEWKSADGKVRRCHPIIASFVIDYPEQCETIGVVGGECVLCKCPHNRLGEHADFAYRNPEELHAALQLRESSDPRLFTKKMSEIRMHPLYLNWWVGFPYINPFVCVTPDLLHQLRQGIISYLIQWATKLVTRDELNFRSRILPQCHGIRHFASGICTVVNASGQEHANMAAILVGILNDFTPTLPEGAALRIRFIRAVRSLIDFTFIAGFHVQSSSSLDRMDELLNEFHTNKDVFIDLGLRTSFDIPKLHWLLHYVRQIYYKGSADNFDTQFTERAHIDFVKALFRHTNKKDILHQMVRMLERFEKLFGIKILIERDQFSLSSADVESTPTIFQVYEQTLPLRPTHTAKLSDIQDQHHAPHLLRYINKFLVGLRAENPIQQRNLQDATTEETWRIQHLDIFHQLKFNFVDKEGTADIIYARPASRYSKERFDAATVFWPSKDASRGISSEFSG